MAMRRGLATAALLAAFAARGGCLDDIRRNGVLIAGNGIMGDKPSLWQEQDGAYHGLDWDILQQLSTRLGVPKNRFVITEWTSLIPGLKARRWDLILSDMEVTQERIVKAHMRFS